MGDSFDTSSPDPRLARKPDTNPNQSPPRTHPRRLPKHRKHHPHHPPTNEQRIPSPRHSPAHRPRRRARLLRHRTDRPLTRLRQNSRCRWRAIHRRAKLAAIPITTLPHRSAHRVQHNRRAHPMAREPQTCRCIWFLHPPIVRCADSS